jgi:hypothetical protein
MARVPIRVGLVSFLNDMPTEEGERSASSLLKETIALSCFQRIVSKRWQTRQQNHSV